MKAFFYSILAASVLLSCNTKKEETPKQEVPTAQTSDIDLSKFELTWSDEFDYPDSQLEEKWISDNQSYEGSFVLCSRWRENAEVKDGVLELKARKEQRGNQDWTCGNVWTKEAFGYGYFECRYKYVGATGTNNSFWLWPKIGVDEGEKAFELDINEGHYPNIVNTNIHNWTDKDENGDHEQNFKDFRFEGKADLYPDYTYTFEKPIQAKKVRLKSNNHTYIHIGEFRVYAPNANGYPKDAWSITADTDVEGLVNYTRQEVVNIATSGEYKDPIRKSESTNIADGTREKWISQIEGEKWLEVEFDEAKEVGAIQFTNGWDDHGGKRNLMNDFVLEYFNGVQWVEIASVDGAPEKDFSEEYHVHGFEWTPTEFKFYFDGKLHRTVPHTLCHAETNILLSLAILDWDIAGAVTDEIDGKSMKVDYVRYYKPKE